jgi:trimeric autotransporter adhesin
MVKRLYAALVILTLLVCGCSGSSNSSPGILRTIVVSPASVTIAPGTTAQLRAIGYYTDGNNLDLTNAVTWSSSNTAAGTVGSNGVVTGVGIGSSTITASSGGVSGTATLNTAAVQSITVTAPPQPLLAGASVQLKANATLADGTSQNLTNYATWSSSNTGVATVTSPGGMVTGVSAGAANITATFGSASGIATVNVVNLVSIAPLTPANPVVAVGATEQFTATGTLSDNTMRDVTAVITWQSSNPAVATITAGGLAKTLLPGTTTISASYGTVNQSTTLTVQPPTSITVTPANVTTAVGASQQFTATGGFADGSTRDLTSLVTWSSSANGVATISNTAGSNGLASAAGNGATTITATLGGAGGPFVGSTRLDVKTLSALDITPANTSVARGSTVKLSARATFNDGSTQDFTESATWTSSIPSIASVSNAAGSKGLVSGNALGSANITARAGSATASTTIQVTSGSVVPPQNLALVSNFGSNNVSVVDTAGNTIIKNIPVGTGPQGIAINSSTNRAYVANSTANTVSVIDIVNNVVVATINVGGTGPWNVAVNPTTNRAYVTNSLSNSVSVIDTLNNQVVTTITVGTNPKGIAISPGTNRLYVTNYNANTISVIDTARNAVVDTIAAGAGPVDVAVNATAGRLFVANNSSQVLSVIDTNSDSLVTEVAVGTGAQVVAVSPSTNRAYVSVANANNLSVIDTTTNKVVTTVTVGGGPRGVAVKASANRVYVVNHNSNTVSVLDTTTNAVVAQIPGFIAPTYIAVVQ